MCFIGIYQQFCFDQCFLDFGEDFQEYLTLKPYFKSLLVDLKYVYTKSGVVHSGNNVW